jgi:UDP-glucose 4-epimerase
MRVLITGGGGFIGGRLANFLHTAGYEIIIASRTNNSVIQSNKNYTYTLINWDDTNSLDYVCNGVNIVIHAAGMNSIDSCQNPNEAIKINGISTGNLYKSAIKNRVSKFIYISTAHVYMSPLLGEINEDTFINNSHPYALSNFIGENLLNWYNQNGIIDNIIIRLSNSFGSPINKETNCWMLYINCICKEAVQHRSITINSDSTNLRNFVPISEVCNVIKFLIKKKCINKNSIYNFGHPKSHSLFEIATLVQERCMLIFGFQPTLKLVKNNSFQNKMYLNYSSSNILNQDFKYSVDFIDEIDSLLLKCDEWFSEK